MATAAQLLDEYRLDQTRTAARTVAELTVAFNRLMDVSAVDRTFPAFLAVALDIIGGQRRRAALLAEAFYAAHRAEFGVAAPYMPYSAGQLTIPQASAGLLVAGPITIKKSMLKGRTLEEAFATALAITLGTAYRYTADGGRFTIQDTAEHDRTALGWARVTDGSPCYFCAMLASRGPVYLTQESATRRADGRKYHNGCGCTAEPVYDRDQPWPGAARHYEQLWKTSTAGLRGKAAVNAFRRAHEGR